MLKKILLLLLTILIIAQFIRPVKNVSQTPDEASIGKVYAVPAEVERILQKACYDCHSNTTHYPWYSYIQPLGWWLHHHIREGKEELNFSEFGTYNFKKQAKKLKKSAREVVDGEMPISSYTWTHRDAVLTLEEKDQLVNWLEDLSIEIATAHNIDMNSKE